MTEKPRSVDQHRRFFGLIKAAFHHWPEQHSFQPDNEEHLRAWLLVKAKHRKIHSFAFSDGAAELARLVPIMTLMMLDRYSWAWPYEDGIRVCVPASVSFKSLPHAEACKVLDNVGQVLRDEAGLEPDDLLKDGDNA